MTSPSQQITGLGTAEHLFEQGTMQEMHHTYRGAAELGLYLSGATYGMVGQSPVARMLGVENELSPLEVLIDGMLARDGSAHWIDLANGYGVAQREIRKRRYLGNSAVQMTGVDLLDRNVTDIPKVRFGTDRVREYLADFGLPDDVFDPAYAPDLVQAPMETVSLDRMGGLVTITEGIQYSRNPMLAIANAYNHVTPGGVAVISSNAYNHVSSGGVVVVSSEASSQTPWVENTRQIGTLGEHTYAAITGVLDAAGIEHAEVGFAKDVQTGKFRSIAIRREPGSVLVAPQRIAMQNRVYCPETVYEPGGPLLQVVKLKAA